MIPNPAMASGPKAEAPGSKWPMARIGDIFDIQQGKALSVVARTATERFPFLRTANVLWGQLDLTTVDAMGMSEAERKLLKLEPGDLLVCEGGEIGRTAVWNGELTDCYHQNHIHRLRPRREADPEFYQYWLQYAFTMTDLYEGAGTKTTIANLSQGRLSNLLIPAPPREEQRWIARILSTIRDAKARADVVLGAVAVAAAAYRRDFFGRAKDSAATIRLGQLDCDVSTGPFGSQLHAHDYVTNGTRVLNPMHLERNAITTGPTPCVDPATATRLQRHRLEEGDVIVPRRGDLGRFAWIAPGMGGDLCGTGCMVIRNRDSRVTSRYMAEYYGSEPAQRFLSEAAGGTIMPNINPKIVLSLPIVVPSIDEQRRFAGASAAFDLHQAAVKNHSRALGDLFESALKKAFGT